MTRKSLCLSPVLAILLSFFSTVLLAQVSPYASITKWDHIAINPQTKSAIPLSDYYVELTTAQNIVLGEYHYNQALQAAQAETVLGVVNAAKANGKFSLGWEFLNIKDQANIDLLFNYFKKGKLDLPTLMHYLQNGNTDALSYGPLMQAVKDLDGQILATNLTRNQKAPVTAGGIAQVDPTLLPPNYKIGGSDYLERFILAMGGHSSPTLLNYFDAQCLTDDVIAFTLLNKANYDLKFLVIGSFHSDYNDGVIVRLKERSPLEKTVHVKFVDASVMTRTQLIAMFEHAKYGVIGDYVMVINEPKP